MRRRVVHRDRVGAALADTLDPTDAALVAMDEVLRRVAMDEVLRRVGAAPMSGPCWAISPQTGHPMPVL